MKKMLLGTLSAAALTMGATGAFAAAHEGDMASVTCEQFLALEAMDQETHATVLMTAMMDDSSMGADSASGDTAATASDDGSMSTDSVGTDSAAMDSTSGDTTSMDSEGTDSAAMDSSSTDSTSMDSSHTDTAAMDSTSTDTATTGTATTGTDSEMASGDTGSGSGMGSDMQLSPTAAALVTICENSSDDMGSTSN